MSCEMQVSFLTRGNVRLRIALLRNVCISEYLRMVSSKAANRQSRRDAETAQRMKLGQYQPGVRLLCPLSEL